MHMADALIRPDVGGAMWLASGALAWYSSKKVQSDPDHSKVPLMGVLGAFVFAAQMINFTIPATGSSGHIGGGMLLSILLGPGAGLLVMFSILAVQALFFADGGLLALGCNVFNLGFWTCFVAYPLVYQPIVSRGTSRGRTALATVLATVAGLQLGALSVVIQTVASGVSDLPFFTFASLMLPIHLAIGLVEGLVTSAVVLFVLQNRPEILSRGVEASKKRPLGPVFIGFGGLAVLTGVVLSWFASAHPDGLEWAIGKTSGQESVGTSQSGVHQSLATLQEKTAILPDYGFGKTDEQSAQSGTGAENSAHDGAVADDATRGKTITEDSVRSGTMAEPVEVWPVVDPGTSLSGLVGGSLVMLVVVLLGGLLRMLQARQKPGI